MALKMAEARQKAKNNLCGRRLLWRIRTASLVIINVDCNIFKQLRGLLHSTAPQRQEATQAS
jgi:hypothetical protein